MEIINEGEDFASGESVDTVSNLDIYLNKLYEKKVKFTVENKVVDFIQHGVESLVQDLMKFVMKQDKIQKEIAELKERFSSATFMDQSELLRVGSFYEGTKNTFPDEFDFIYVVLCSATPELKKNTGCKISIFDRYLQFSIQRMIKHDINEISDYVIKMYENSQYTLEFVGRADLEYQTGPNVKLKLRFKRKISKRNPAEIDIFVDKTPGMKILARNENFISLICPLKPFKEEVCNDGSFLLVSSHNMETKMTFTEKEVKLMKQKLSSRHRKVYRLLKYLINANVDEVKLKSLRNAPHMSDRKFWLSSYELKIIMIYHHYSCKRDESAKVLSCLNDILEWILDCVSKPVVHTGYVYEQEAVYTSIRPLVNTDTFDSSHLEKMQIFMDKRKYIELVKTLLNELISDLKSIANAENHECRDCNFQDIASFSERLYANLQKIKSRKKKKGKLRNAIVIMLLLLIIILLSILCSYHLLFT